MKSEERIVKRIGVRLWRIGVFFCRGSLKPSLCKGGWHGNAVTGGLFFAIPQSACADSSLYTREPFCFFYRRRLFGRQVVVPTIIGKVFKRKKSRVCALLFSVSFSCDCLLQSVDAVYDCVNIAFDGHYTHKVACRECDFGFAASNIV